MRSRRSFLQAALSTIFLPLIRGPQAAAAQAPLSGLAYKDSDSNTDFSSLSDGQTAAGGISYGA